MALPPPEISHVASRVDDRLDQLFRHEQDRWVGVEPRLGEAVAELQRMSGGGKRIRAAFCYWAWRGNLVNLGLGSEQPSEESEKTVIDCGAAFELLQTFALIHDDIMDGADTRRGLETIHIRQARRVSELDWRGEPRRYGEGVAILVGDLSHVYADQLMGVSSPSARAIWDELRIELNLGQYLDMRSAAAGDSDRQTAQDVATFKSALYTIVRPLQLGSALASPLPQPDLLEALDAFGRPVGQAFQLRDDLLGVLGDPDHVGKPVGDDLREGKLTELVASAFERADAGQLTTLSLIGKRDLLPAQVDEIVGVMEATGAIFDIETRIDHLVETASTLAADLPFGADIRHIMVTLANYVASRTH